MFNKKKVKFTGFSREISDVLIEFSETINFISDSLKV